MENRDTFIEALYNSTHGSDWKVIEEYLNQSKKIIEDKLFDPELTTAKATANGAIVLIKMREVINKLIELPKILEGDITIDNINKEMVKITDDLVNQLS